jgi:hypothetical protein
MQSRVKLNMLRSLISFLDKEFAKDEELQKIALKVYNYLKSDGITVLDEKIVLKTPITSIST